MVKFQVGDKVLIPYVKDVICIVIGVAIDSNNDDVIVAIPSNSNNYGWRINKDDYFGISEKDANYWRRNKYSGLLISSSSLILANPVWLKQKEE